MFAILVAVIRVIDYDVVADTGRGCDLPSPRTTERDVVFESDFIFITFDHLLAGPTNNHRIIWRVHFDRFQAAGTGSFTQVW